MNDDNRAGGEYFTLALGIGCIIIYQNRKEILYFFERIVPQIVWFIFVVSFIVGALYSLYFACKYLYGRYSKWQEWVQTVDGELKKYEAALKDLEEWNSIFKNHHRDQACEIRQLKIELEKINPKEKPKAEAIQVEAAKKAEEAANQIFGDD